jgi:hypothetical protein
MNVKYDFFMKFELFFHKKPLLKIQDLKAGALGISC